MHPNTIKPFINMMLFSMMNGLTGTAFVECSDALLDLINLSMEPFGCSAAPFKSKCIDNTVYRWSTEVIALEPRCTLFSKDTDRKQVAANLDELTVANVSDHGYVTLRNPEGDQFMLNAEEAISAIPELQV